MLILGGFKGSLAVAFLYKDLHDLLLTDQAIRSKTDNQRWRYFRITSCRLPPKTRNTETHKIYVKLTWTWKLSKNSNEGWKTPCLSLTIPPSWKIRLNLPNWCNVASFVLVHFQIQFLHRNINSRIMAVTMDPKPETLRENVTLKFKNLKVTWQFVAIRCLDLFWRDKIYFQVLEAEKRCMFWSNLSKR